jgi:hypothetical protein
MKMKAVRHSRIKFISVFLVGTALAAASAPLVAQGSAAGHDKASGGGGRNLNARLKGTYIYSGSGSCVSSAGGFNEFFQANNPPGSVSPSGVQGLMTFDGEGGGSFTLRSLGVTQGGAAAFDAEGPITYQLGADLSLTVTSGTSISTQTHGPSVGQQTLISGVVHRGHVSQDLRTFHIGHVEPQVEYVADLNGTVLTARICFRHRIGTRLHSGH